MTERAQFLSVTHSHCACLPECKNAFAPVIADTSWLDRRRGAKPHLLEPIGIHVVCKQEASDISDLRGMETAFMQVRLVLTIGAHTAHKQAA